MATKTTAKLAVKAVKAAKAGAALYDQTRKGWFWKVRVTELDLSHPCACIIGQVEGGKKVKTNWSWCDDDQQSIVDSDYSTEVARIVGPTCSRPLRPRPDMATARVTLTYLELEVIEDALSYYRLADYGGGDGHHFAPIFPALQTKVELARLRALDHE